MKNVSQIMEQYCKIKCYPTVGSSLSAKVVNKIYSEVGLVLQVCFITRAAPKVIPPIFICWFTMSDVDVGGTEVDVKLSRKYYITFPCHGTDSSSGSD